jgi:outer membrane receptor protein involved in Fe transport
MPGSNPLFGLNALGGAVTVQTKTGFSFAGHDAAVSGGSFGRRQIDASSGGHTDRLGYFVAGTLVGEDGWRDHSPSTVRRLFGDVTWRRSAATTFDASVTAGDNRLIGNSAAPIDLLAQDRAAVFTFPDETRTKMTLLSLRGRHVAATGVLLDGTLYYRRASIHTFNGDDSNYEACDAGAFEGLLCGDDHEPVEDQLGDHILVGDDDFDATNNTSRTTTNGWGGAVQLTITRPLAGRANHFVMGATSDGGRSEYGAETEIARLTDERGTLGTGRFDRDAAVGLRSRVRHTGAFAADFFTVAPRLTVMGAARLTHSRMVLRDEIGEDLTGDHVFTRLNPAAGLTVALTHGVSAYTSVSVASRVPAPSELSCADPDDPCRLPNAFQGDPPLEQVVSRTWESGLRGHRRSLTWSLAAFRTVNDNDIMFISSGALTNTGHFENVGGTVREGLEAGVSGRTGVLRWSVGYSVLRALFEVPLTLSSPNHPDADNGEIRVEPGDRLPGIPGQNLKIDLSAVLKRLTIGGGLTMQSAQFLRGDEANLLPQVDGYAVSALTARYAIGRRLAVTGRVTNLFGAEYATFGLLGEAGDVLGDDYDDPRFLSPGAPRAAWIGLELSWP